MNQQMTNAKAFKAMLLEGRRAAIKKGISRSSGVDVHLIEELTAFHRAMTTIEAIEADEKARFDGDEYARHEAAGTLNDDGAGNLTIPTSA